MKTIQVRSLIIAGTAAALLTLASCATTPSQQAVGTGVGAGAGALLGAIAGNNIDGISRTEGAIAGALVGGVLGNVQGRQQDQINSIRNENALNNQTVVNVTNSNGSSTPVVLQRVGGQWQGPRGEIYPNVPSESQLRSAYGLCRQAQKCRYFS